MSKAFSRRFFLIMGFMIMIGIAAIGICTASASAAEEQPEQEAVKPYAANHDSITFSRQYSEPWKSLWLKKTADGRITYENITNISCPDNNILVIMKAKQWNGALTPYIIYPLKAGTTTIRVTAPDNSIIDIPVTITKDYFVEAFKTNSYFGLKKEYSRYDNKILYGERKYVGHDVVPKTNITIKVSGEKAIKTKASQEGDFSFKFKKIFKTGTKVSIKYSANGVSYTDKLKVAKWSKLSRKKGIIKASSGKKIKIGFKVANLHKGDYIVLKVDDMKYTKPIKKYKNKTVYVTIDKVAKKTPFKVMLKNKFDQNMVVKDLFI